MLRADYLERLIREVFDALRRALTEELPAPERLRDVRALYDTFGAPPQFFHEAGLPDVVRQVCRSAAASDHCQSDEVDPGELLQRLDLLAALLHTEWLLTPDDPPGARQELRGQALTLLTYVDERATTYSLERRQRLAQLQRQP